MNPVVGGAAAGKLAVAPRVALFVTCVADVFGAGAAAAAVRLLRGAGCPVIFPEDQTCCGQPAYNSGHHDQTRAVALHFLRVFEGVLDSGAAEYIVTPSGSCGGMVHHYADLFPEGSADRQRAIRVAEKTYELTQFLVNVLGVTATGADLSGVRVAYHDSCHAMRLMGVRDEPRLLLKAAGAELIPWDESCCGFGGLFSVKLPELSGAMMDRKLRSLEADAPAAQYLTSTDLGCLLQLAGGMRRNGRRAPSVHHIAELLVPGRVAAGTGILEIA